MSTVEKHLMEIIKNYEMTGKFSVSTIDLDSNSTSFFVQFKSNPQRFLPAIFDGLWAFENRHPGIGEVRLIRVIKGNDDVTRVICRQGNEIYAFPWFL